MSSKIVNLRETIHFKFPEQYTENDQTIFGGREKDCKNLSLKIEDVQSLVLHGKSNVGKTSTIIAGLIPGLRVSGWTPIYIKGYTYPIQDVLESVNRVVGQHLKFEFSKNLKLTVKNILSQLMVMAQQEKLVLIFDQFEELYIKFEKENPILRKFSQLLNAIILADNPNIRLVFVVRDEYLPSIYKLGLNIPRTAKNSYWLKSFDSHSALAAISIPMNAYGIRVDQDLLDEALQSLSVFDYEPFFIRLLFNEIIDLALIKDRYNTNLTVDDLEMVGGFEGVVCKQLGLISGSNTQVSPSIINGILATLVIRHEPEQKLVINDLKNALVLANERDTLIALQVLIRSSFVKSHNYEKHAGQKFIKHRLIHENLSPLIADWLCDNTENKEFNAIREIIMTSVSADIWHHNSSAYLSFDQLNKLNTHYRHRLSLDDNEIRFLFESAVYQRSPILEYLANKYGQASVLDHLGKCFRSSNQTMRIRAGQAVMELGKQGFPLQALADQMLNIALSNEPEEVRSVCGSALAHVYEKPQLERLKTETRKIRFSLWGFCLSIIYFVLNQFRSEVKNHYSIGRHTARALDVLVNFHEQGQSLDDFRPFVRRKALSVWLKRQINEKRRELHSWIYQGRIIGISAAFNWFFTIGFLMLIIVSNVFYLDKYRNFAVNIGFTLSILLPLIILGLFFGRSMSKTAFIKHEIKKKRNITQFIFRNPLYISFVSFFLIISLLIFSQAKIEKIVFFLFGPIVFWLMIPFFVQILNRLNRRYLRHDLMLQGKSYFGSTILLLLGLGAGLLLNNYYHDTDLFFYFLIVGSVTSATFMMIYTSINFLIKRHTEAQENYSKKDVYVSEIFNVSLILLSISCIGYLFIQLYGTEALLGPWRAKALSHDTNRNLYFVDDNYHYGPEDTNYYSFELVGEDPFILKVPDTNKAATRKNEITQLLFNGYKKVDLKFAIGESFIIPPGKHFLATKTGEKNSQTPWRPLNFSFQVEQVQSAGLSKPLIIKKNQTRDLNAVLATWKKMNNGWYTDIAIDARKIEDKLKLRIHKNLYAQDIDHSVSAQITIDGFGDVDQSIKVNILKPDSLERISDDRFYVAETEDFRIIDDAGVLKLRLFLSGGALDPGLALVKTILLLDLTVKY